MHQTELGIAAAGPHGAIRTPWRWALTGMGTVCVGLGLLGVFVPGLPTTVFLIVASWCYVRSCPHLERRLREHRVLGRYMRYVGGGAVMPRRARVAATALMWACIATSVVLLRVGGETGWWFAGVMAVLGMLGTWAIWVIARGPSLSTATPAA